MQYLGGKTRIAAALAWQIAKARRPGQLVWDAFCGGLSVSRALAANGPVLSTDANAALVHLYLAVQDGWEPPTHVDAAMYAASRLLPDTDPLKAFCGFGMSFGGKWFAGLSKPRPKYRFPAVGCAKVLKRDVVGLTIRCLDFLSVDPAESDQVIYLDPPYRGTTGYAGMPPFAHDAFQSKALAWSRFCHVFVSEYQFPYGTCVWEGESLTAVASGITGTPKRATERLFWLPKTQSP
jgi:DNA adenine methylase